MINPSTIASALVAKLQAIPEVITELDGSPSNIQSYEDSYPDSLTIGEVVLKQSNPSIVVVWNGSGPGNYKKGEVWEHRFSLLCKTQNLYSDLFTAIANGIPSASTDDGQPFRRTLIVNGCDPIATLSCDRRQLYISDFTAIDYFEISFTLAERGPDL